MGSILLDRFNFVHILIDIIIIIIIIIIIVVVVVVVVIIIIIIIIILLYIFSHQLKLMNFLWSLSDSKSPKISRILLSILADLNNVVVFIVSTRPLISKSSQSY